MEGGLRAVPEGLRDSPLPCTKGLSVPGFFAILELFLSGRREFSAGKEALFLQGEASFSQPR